MLSKHVGEHSPGTSYFGIKNNDEFSLGKVLLKKRHNSIKGEVISLVSTLFCDHQYRKGTRGHIL